VLVACSGGADSLALLAATVFEARKLDIRVVGVTVDHGLQEGSAEHADRVVQQMAALGVDETASARGSSIRRARYGGGGTRGPLRRARAEAGSTSVRSWCCSVTPSTTRRRRCCWA
jgi:tRNA(Ile)-lysidine synthase